VSIARPARGRLPPAILGLLLLAAPPASGMGLGGEDEPTARIPEPAMNWRVRVTDVDMQQIEVVRASFDGHVFLTGMMGKAKVSVPFEKIEKVVFEPTGEGRDLLAVVALKGGGQQSLVVHGRTPCFGEAPFGNVEIELRHLRDAVFVGRVEGPGR